MAASTSFSSSSVTAGGGGDDDDDVGGQSSLFATMIGVVVASVVVAVLSVLGLFAFGISRFLPPSSSSSSSFGWTDVARATSLLSIGIVAFLFLLAVLFAILAVSGVQIADPSSYPSIAWNPDPSSSESKKRSKSLGRTRFNPKTSPLSYDVVVIGSGIGGLTAGAVLTTLGYEVCVLESHEVCGGSTHEYVVPECAKYKFPSGLHYVIPTCQQVLQISAGACRPPVTFERLGNGEGVYERIRLTRCRRRSDNGGEAKEEKKEGGGGGEEEGGDAEEPDLPIVDESQLKSELRRRFPGLETQLDRYIDVATKVLTCFPLWSALHLLPWSLRKPLLQTVMPQIWYEYASRTAESVLTELFDDAPESERRNVRKLHAYLCGLWVDTGCPPHRASFFMIAAVSLGFPHEGGAYPVGGPQEMSLSLVKRIEDGGGRCYVRAPASRILLDEEGTTATGVVMHEGRCGGAELKARKCVVSACGFRNTSRLLLLPKRGASSSSASVPKAPPFPSPSSLSIPQGEGFCMANVGFRVPPHIPLSDLGLECANLWPQPAGDDKSIFDGVRDYLNDPLGVPTSEIPAMITFPSLKDRGYEGEHHTAQILVLAKIGWFATGGGDAKEDDDDRDDDPDERVAAWKHPERTAAYAELKVKWTQRLRELFVTCYPQLEDKIELFDLSTPLSIEHYLPTGSGSAIGLDVNASSSSSSDDDDDDGNGKSGTTGCRFTDLDVMKTLDMKTPIANLWMTGQDTLLCGVPLAQAAGLMTALRVAGLTNAMKFGWRAAWLLLATFGEESREERRRTKKKKAVAATAAATMGAEGVVGATKKKEL